MVTYCIRCGKPIHNEESETCPNCGIRRQSTSSPYQSAQGKKITNFAGIWDRWFAYLLDFLFIGVIFIFVIAIFFILNVPQLGFTISLIFIIPAYILYSAYFESSQHQATYGKRVQKLKVIDKNGGRITFKTSLLRSFVKFFTTFSPLGIIALLHAIFIYYHNPERKGVHDIVAGTYVINSNF